MTLRPRRILATLKSCLALGLVPCLTLSACGDDAGPAKPDATTVADTAVTDAAGDTSVDAAGDFTTTSDATPDVPAGDPVAQKAILDVKATKTWQIPGLSAPVHVVRTEADVPHVYAQNRKDLAIAMGFVMARHRYFQMELTRRFGLGEVSALLGDAALQTDMESRSSGSRFVAQRLMDRLTPDQQVIFDGFAAGINVYIAQVAAGKLDEPSEIALAKGLLGKTAADLMKPWDRWAVAGAAAAIIYNLGYETDDVGRTSALAAVATKFEGKPLADLRKAGALADVEYLVAPIDLVSSAAGSGLDKDGKPIAKTEYGKVPNLEAKWAGLTAKLPPEMLARSLDFAARWERRNGHDKANGFGSNAWAVTGKAAADGRALLAGDGHLPLSVPSLFYQIGLDTSVFGGGPTHQTGLVIPGMPFLAVGTNGQVAWSQTQLVGDITDWYRDVVVLDDKGLPKATKFGKDDKPLTVVEETFEIANVPLLDSKGRTEKWPRFVTWDGRWITNVEGPTVDPAKYTPASGEAIVWVGGHFVVPKDTDKDGKITAFAFDFTGLDNPAIIDAVDGFGHSADVYQLRDETRKLVAYSQNIVAADSAGHVLYTGYQAVPCRKHLPRNADGTWKPGADPKQLIDGTTYTGFTIPLLPDGRVDESKSADPTTCVVPFDGYPQSIDPPQGFVVTANNDPGNLSTDGSLFNDPWYIGGPWANGYRAGTIAKDLQAQIAAKTADTQGMAKLQANNQSRLGDEWVPFVQEAVQHAADLAKKATWTEDEQRVVALYQELTATNLDDLMARLQKWHAAGSPALSGVQTFYHDLQPGEAEHAVATSIFNAWMDRFVALTVEDEGLGLWEPWGNDARTRTLTWIRKGRGPGNPLKQASWNPATGESAFFDRLDTAPIETSREVALLALKEALPQLEKDFGTKDRALWLWGLRHGVRFDSIIAKFFGGSSQFAGLTEAFSITPATLSEMTGKLADLPHFPRGGDAFAVDAAGGIGGGTYGSGPVFRMVIALGQKTTGLNILPGGQSGITDSAFFADQAKLWMGNKALPLRHEIADVVAGAVSREVLQP